MRSVLRDKSVVERKDFAGEKKKDLCVRKVAVLFLQLRMRAVGKKKKCLLLLRRRWQVVGEKRLCWLKKKKDFAGEKKKDFGWLHQRCDYHCGDAVVATAGAVATTKGRKCVLSSQAN